MITRARPAAALVLVLMLAVGFTLGAAAGCTHAPLVTVRPGTAPTAEALLQVLAARRAALRSLNARVRATSWIGGDRLRATVLMLVERGGRLRFEAEISLQGTVSILTTDGAGRFQLLDMRNNQLQQGPACPANVASMIRIPLAPAEVAGILLGDVWLPPSVPDATGGAATISVAWDGARGADVLVVRNGDRAPETRVFFHPDSKGEDIIGVTVSGPAGPLWRTSYEELQDTPGGLRLPAVVRFAERAGSFDDGVEIRFKDRTPNPELSAASFEIRPPAGTRAIEVGCNGADGAPARP
jgi:hypothetical protein